MAIHLPARQANRRAFVASGLAFFLSGLAAQAQDAGLTREKLEALIERTLAAPDTTPIARPAILGFLEQKLTTKSIERGEPAHKHGFMVVIPRREDGLIFFEGKDADPFFFAMHRSGEHLNRVASAINRNGDLSNWSGPEAEQNFADQKAFWASES
ncbi:MAG TPA: hypothetical protein VKX28_18055 [Xanthobacteraceae bacterium]|nr:hypothetical protein [Xanthobacteraceae bacterium]